MTPEQFKKARNLLELSQAQLAHILNTDPRTIRRWEKEDNTRPPNPIACRVVMWMMEGFRPNEWPTTTDK